MHEVWARAKRGLHTAVIGATPPEPTDGRVVVRIDCEGPWSTFGPLEDARRRIELLLGDPSPEWDEALERLGTGVLTRFLGDVEDPTIEATLVAAANRLAAKTDGEAVVVFECVDHADAATVQGLEHILSREGWLVLPMVVHVGSRSGTVAELLSAVHEVGGDDALIEQPVDADAAATGTPVPFDWATLSPDVLRVLRAASVVGRTFESELVASLLDESPTRVLELLQRATDEGAPIADRGQGRFFFPPSGPAALQNRLLPSLLEHYNLRLATLLSPPRRARETGGVSIPPPGRDGPAPPDPSVSYGKVLADSAPRRAAHATSGAQSARPTENVPIAPPERSKITIDPAPARRRPPRG